MDCRPTSFVRVLAYELYFQYSTGYNFYGEADGGLFDELAGCCRVWSSCVPTDQRAAGAAREARVLRVGRRLGPDHAMLQAQPRRAPHVRGGGQGDCDIRQEDAPARSPAGCDWLPSPASVGRLAVLRRLRLFQIVL